MSEGEVKDLLTSSYKEVCQEAEKGKPVKPINYNKLEGSKAIVEYTFNSPRAVFQVQHRNSQANQVSETRQFANSLILCAQNKLPAYLNCTIFTPRDELHKHTIVVKDFNTLIANHESYVEEVARYIAENWEI